MLFNSVEFLLVFLPIVAVVYFGLTQSGGGRVARLWLLFASLFFYAWWRPAYLPLILGSIVFNFALGSALIRDDRRASGSILLFFGVSGNLLLLGYFKYTEFAIENMGRLLDLEMTPPDLVLPIAISFFTFQQIAYLVDCHRNEVRRSSFTHYALFVTFFPQLIAGPIVHHKEMMGQFAQPAAGRVNPAFINLGLFLLSVGLFKKVVLADTFAQWATNGFDVIAKPNAIEAWISSLSYTFQLYFDFSGYADMAVGAAMLFNIRLPLNFMSPYKSSNITEFWRSWHITLGRFLRDYLYIPLGGNRKGFPRHLAALGTTFLLGGLWHGASWMFVIWGALHGLAVITHRVWTSIGRPLPIAVGWAITFLFVNFAWVFFRAREIDDAFKIIKGMLGMNGLGLDIPLALTIERVAYESLSIGLYGIEIAPHVSLPLWFAAATLIVFWSKNSNELILENQAMKRSNYLHALAFGTLATLSLAMVTSSSYTEFIYFNF